MDKIGYIYIMTNNANTVLYIGVTSNLVRRVNQHKNHTYRGFTYRYNCEKLVYFEQYGDVGMAIKREKQLKGWHREWKNNLISEKNSEWVDLAEGLFTLS